MMIQNFLTIGGERFIIRILTLIVTYLLIVGIISCESDKEDELPVLNSTLRCPDSNHPHSIDLGLPSGTKWCCCNVCASVPEEYGGYFAWGETEEKRVYNHDSYKFHDNEQSVYDISGTQDDVARVRMGFPWRIPSSEQQQELVDHCKWEWTLYNGVKGFKITGSNGGQIFLPAAGVRRDEGIYSEGEEGGFWPSTYKSNNGLNYLFISSRIHGVCAWTGHCFGLSIRPVYP